MRLPPRPVDSHKGTFGTVGLLAGSAGMLGAAILAARGAVRGGAGLVRAFLPEELMAPFTVAVPAATTRPRPTRGREVALAVHGCSALVVGPGLGDTPATRTLVRAVLRAAAVPTVLDADALNVLAPLATPLRGDVPRILTPHPGEAARLLGLGSAAEVQADRGRAVRDLAERSGQVCVLKGAETLVCDGKRPPYRNKTGNPGLATGGSGDVLAGLMAALLAQGMAPFDAACLAVWVHGRAGDLVARRLSQAGLSAEDLPLAIAEVMRNPRLPGRSPGRRG